MRRSDRRIRSSNCAADPSLNKSYGCGPFDRIIRRRSPTFSRLSEQSLPAYGPPTSIKSGGYPFSTCSTLTSAGLSGVHARTTSPSIMTDARSISSRTSRRCWALPQYPSGMTIWQAFTGLAATSPATVKEIASRLFIPPCALPPQSFWRHRPGRWPRRSAGRCLRGSACRVRHWSLQDGPPAEPTGSLPWLRLRSLRR